MIPALLQIGGTELLILLVIILLLFGAKRIPQLARSMRTGNGEFREGISGAYDDQDEAAQGGETGPSRGVPAERSTFRRAHSRRGAEGSGSGGRASKLGDRLPPLRAKIDLVVQHGGAQEFRPSAKGASR